MVLACCIPLVKNELWLTPRCKRGGVCFINNNYGTYPDQFNIRVYVKIFNNRKVIRIYNNYGFPGKRIIISPV